MECGDKPNADLDSMDLYSRVKLRGMCSKARIIRKDVFPATDDNIVSAGLRKPKASFVNQRFSLDLATNLENQVRQNGIAGETSRLRSLMEITVQEIDEWKNYNKDLGTKRVNAHDFDESNHLLDEGTAIEMLGQLRDGRTTNVFNQFDIGDLVWGKIQSHPWWPGQIYNEALASPSVFSTKREGRVLVTFFGDYTYAWLHPRHLVPFDIHYAGKSGQTNDRVFLKAVTEAISEYKRRTILGLVCHCLSPFNFRPIGKLFEVDFNGFIAGGIYSAKQIDKARNGFQPDETLAFLKQMAISPRNSAPQNLSSVKNIQKILFYRRVSLRNFDETNSQAVEVQQRSFQDPTSSLVDKAALVRLLEAKFRENEALKQPTKASDLQNRDNILGQASWGRFSHQGSLGHEMQIPSEISDCIVSDGPHDKTLQKQIRSGGATNAGKKRNISGLLELSSRKKPVWQNNMEDLSRIAGNQKLFEAHGEERIGIATDSSIKLEKEPEMERNQPRTFFSRAECICEFKPALQQFPIPENIKREPCLEELAEDGPSCTSVFASPSLASSNGGSEIPHNMVSVAFPWTYPVYCTTEQFGFNQNVDDISKKYCQDDAMKNNDNHSSTSANGIEAEKKDKLINLLYSCSDILGQIKHLI